MNETIGTVTLVAYRNKGTYGNVTLLFFAQSLEAQQGLDYNTSETVRHNMHSDTTRILTNSFNSESRPRIQIKSRWG